MVPMEVNLDMAVEYIQVRYLLMQKCAIVAGVRFQLPWFLVP